MNYYNELIDNIEYYISQKDFYAAKTLILDELKLTYIPRDIEKKLYELLSLVKDNIESNKNISDEDIASYLYLDNNHQLLAVATLDSKNLRNYIDICFTYLKANGYKNAKVLLIDSLIRQEINFDFIYVDNDIQLTFNPSKMCVLEESEAFKSSKKYLEDYYLKNPSMFKLGMDLLYKDLLLNLPFQLNENEGINLAGKISKYIDDAFNA